MNLVETFKELKAVWRTVIELLPAHTIPVAEEAAARTYETMTGSLRIARPPTLEFSGAHGYDAFAGKGHTVIGAEILAHHPGDEIEFVQAHELVHHLAEHPGNMPGKLSQKNELMADRIAVQITGNKVAAIGFLSRAAKMEKAQLMADIDKPFIPTTMTGAKKRMLQPAERLPLYKRPTRTELRAADTHPSTDRRILNILMTDPKDKSQLSKLVKRYNATTAASGIEL